MSEDQARRASLTRTFQGHWEEAQSSIAPLEVALAAKYQSVLASHGREAVRAFESAIVAAALPGVVPDELIPPEAFKQSVKARTLAARKRIVNEVASILLGSILAEKAATIPVFAGILDTLAEAQAQYALEAQQDAVSSVIMDAHQEGWSVDETSDELRKVLKDYAPWQATRLARTDLISLANATSLASAQMVQEGPRYKIWLTAQDDRVRPTHVTADRQAVPIDQPFTVEGVAMMYPGDPTAPPELIMNCRCTQVYADTPNPVLSHTFNGGNEEGDELALAADGGELVPLGLKEELADPFYESLTEAITTPLENLGSPIRRFPPLLSDDQLEEMISAGWNATQHPRHGKGSDLGGQFAPKDGTSSAVAQEQAYDAAQATQKMEATRIRSEIGEIPTDLEELRSDLLNRDLTDAQRNEWERVYRDQGGWWPRNSKDWSTAEGEKLREEMATTLILAAAVEYTASSMIALYPERPELLAQENGQQAEDLHVTLAFLPEGYNGDTDLLMKILAGVAGFATVLEGQVGGVGYFTPGENGVPMIALPDVEGLAELRQSVVNALDVTGTTYAQNHGFSPHITLTYTEIEDPETPDVIGIPLRFTNLCLVAGPDRLEFPLGQVVTSAASEAKVPTNGDEMSYEPRPDAPVAERVVALRSILPETQIAEVLAAEDEWFEPGLFERVGATREEVIAMYAAASQSTLIPVDIPPTTITFSPQFLIQVPQQAPPAVTVLVPEQAPQPAPVIEVNLPSQEPPVVQVNVPEAPAPVVQVDVAAPEINIPETVVNVAAPKAPVVNVTVPENDRRVTFKRDRQGKIISAEIEED